MVGQINLVVEEVGGRGEGLGDVGKHVHHGLVDGRPVGAAIDPLAVLRKGWEVEEFSGSVPAEVGQFCTVAEAVVQRNILDWEITSHRI